MADRTRKYDIYGRKKLPRNKWGLLGDEGTNGSIFNGGGGSSSSSAFDTIPIGDIMTSLETFKGATETEDGYKGLVPAPLAGMHQYYYLGGNGEWGYIPAAKWFKEWPESEGLEKRGLSIDGDFNVTKTLSTLNLRVEGQAHFWSLIIDEVKANGGQVMVSPSLFFVDHVGSIIPYDTINVTDSNILTLFKARPDIYNAIKANNIASFRARRLYMRCDDGSKRTKNEVNVFDMMRCKTFNINDGTSYNVKNTDYWSFVIKVDEEPYIEIDNTGQQIEREAFYIDLVYSMRTSAGKIIPIGSMLYTDGHTIDIPDTYTEVSNILELKKVSQQVLTGDYAGEEEQLDGQELIDVQNKVIQIRGINDAITSMIGNASTNNVSVTNLPRTARQMNYLASGDTSGFHDDEYAQVILDGTFPLDDTDSPQGLDLLQAERAVNGTVSGGDRFIPSSRLIIDKADQVDIVVEEDTVLPRDFIAAEDLEDGNGTVIFDAGDTVPSGTTTLDRWKLIDIEPIDDVFEEIDPKDGSDPVVVIPTNETEINTQTDNTSTGLSRDRENETTNYAEQTEWAFGYGIFTCHEGDQLACLGHLYDTDRQNAIVLSANTPIDPELVAPCIAQYSGIDRFGESISKFRMTSIAANGNEFTGSFLVSYNDGNTLKYIDVNDRINMFMTDITSGLEKVGIHLDGDNSTITLVGNVDLRQHSNDNYDTLNVYDYVGTKRVEITPLKIPSRVAADSPIADVSKCQFNTVSATKNATSNYVQYDNGYYDWVYYRHYRLNNYEVNLTTSANLGYLSMNSVIDIRNLDLTFYAKAYFCGNKYVTDHGNGTQQKLTQLTFILKRDGIQVTSVNLLNNSSLNVSGLDKEQVTIKITNAVLDNYGAPNSGTTLYSGTYTCELQFKFLVHAHYYDTGLFTKKVENPYYKINAGLSGSVECLSQRAIAVNDNMNNTKMTIGNNGLVFAGNNSRYVYIATDGYDMKWDDLQLSMDSTNGIRKNGGYRKITGTNSINTKDDVVECSKSGSGYDVTLPSAEDYGIGRILFVSAFQGLKLKRKGTDYIYHTTSDGTQTKITIEFGGGSGDNNTVVMPKYTVTLISGGKGWYIISYL